MKLEKTEWESWEKPGEEKRKVWEKNSDCQELNEIKSYWHFTERPTIKGMKGIFRLSPQSPHKVAFLPLNFPDK